MKLNALREKRNKKVAEARGFVDKAAAENREMTEDEVKQYDAAMLEVSKLNDSIKRVENLESVEAELEETAGTRVTTQRAPAPEARKEFESLAEFVATAVMNPNDQRLAGHFNEYSAEQRMDTGSMGGFAVPTQFRGDLLQIEPQQAIVRPRARVIEPGSPPDSSISMPALDQTSGVTNNVYGGVTVTWTGEGATVNVTDAKLREVTLTPKEFSARVPMTIKLLRNWGAAQAVITQLLRSGLTAAEDDAFLNGNGVGRPLGIKNAGAVQLVNRTLANQIKVADIDAMIARMLMRGTGPVWVASQSIMTQLLALVDADGRRIWAPDVAGVYPGTMYGRPVMWNERSPILGSKGDLALVDPSYYLIKDGSGPFIEVGHATGEFEANKISIKIVSNTDGQPWLTEPFKQEGGYLVSPFVVLNTP